MADASLGESEELVAAAQAEATAVTGDKLQLEEELFQLEADRQTREHALAQSQQQTASLLAKLAEARATVQANHQASLQFRQSAAVRQLAAALKERLGNSVSRIVQEWFKKSLTDHRDNAQDLILRDQRQTKTEAQQLETKVAKARDQPQVPAELLDRAMKSRLLNKQDALTDNTSVSQFAASVSVLSLTTQLRMNPIDMRKAGFVVQNLQKSGFSNDEINDVCRVLFLEQSDEYLRSAWLVFSGGKESIAVAEFDENLLLLGESITPEEAVALIEMADEESTGVLSYAQFVKIFKAIAGPDVVDKDDDSKKEGGIFGISLF